MKLGYSTKKKFQGEKKSIANEVSQVETCERYSIYPVKLKEWKKQVVNWKNLYRCVELVRFRDENIGVRLNSN